MDISRETRARSLEFEKFGELIGRIRRYDAVTGLTPRSGIRDTVSTVVSIINSGNDMIDKCIMVFSSLSVEIDDLVQEARTKFYDSLLLYARESIVEQEGGIVLMMSEFLPFLHELLLFVNRCYEVFRNLLLQLYSFFRLGDNQLYKARERHLTRSWRYAGEILAVLLTLDEIVMGNPMLRQHWAAFTKSMQSVFHNPAQFDAQDARLKPLQNIIANLELQILSGNILSNCCQQCFSSEIRHDKAFMERIQKIINEMLIRWERLSQEDVPDKQRLIVIVSLTIFYQHLYPQLDKKLLKSLAATHKRIAAFHLIGDLLWTPVEFVVQQLQEADKAIDKKTISAVAAAKAAMLDQQAEVLTKETKLTEDLIEEWKAEMHETKTQKDFNNNTHAYLSDRCVLILKGARMADKISRLLRCALNGHLVLNRSMTKTSAQSIFRFMELIKEVESTYRKFWPLILEWCMHASQYWSGCILRILETIRTSMSENVTNIDVVSAILVAESVLGQTPTKTRLLSCGVALELANYTKTFQSGYINEIDDLLTRLDSIANFGTILNRVTDCSFFYWHKNLAKIYFESIIDDKLSNNLIENFMYALMDSCTMLRSSRHCSPESIVSQFTNEMFSDLKEFFLKRLCTDIENDLRLAVHSHQHSNADSLENLLFSTKKAPNTTPYEVEKNVHLFELLKLKTFIFGEEVIDVKKYVTKYLEKSFYELAAVAMHDCETYAKMRILAFHRYELDLIDSRFPFMTIDQGVDVLAIMHGIHEFVTTYNYDLNEQVIHWSWKN